MVVIIDEWRIVSRLGMMYVGVGLMMFDSVFFVFVYVVLYIVVLVGF